MLAWCAMVSGVVSETCFVEDLRQPSRTAAVYITTRNHFVHDLRRNAISFVVCAIDLYNYRIYLNRHPLNALSAGFAKHSNQSRRFLHLDFLLRVWDLWYHRGHTPPQILLFLRFEPTYITFSRFPCIYCGPGTHADNNQRSNGVTFQKSVI